MAVPIALIVVIVVAGALVYLTRGPSTSTTTSSATSTPSVPLSSNVNLFIQDINARNVDGITGFYTEKSVVVWSGNTGGLSGQYTGTGNIRLTYATTVGKTTTISVNSSKYAEDVFSPTHINATYVLKMLANSTSAGKVNATISVRQEWNWGNGGWQISKENWVYDYFDASLLDLKLGSATTFPQWGVMEAGGNPNLVSEKSFEWNAGPFLAASVYAFLLTIALVAAARFFSRFSRDRGP